MTLMRLEHNDRMAKFETDLLDLNEGGGLVNRTQFKHVIFAPQKWSGYEEAFFPGVRDAIDEGNGEEVRRQIELVAGIVGEAARGLNRGSLMEKMREGG